VEANEWCAVAHVDIGPRRWRGDGRRKSQRVRRRSRRRAGDYQAISVETDQSSPSLRDHRQIRVRSAYLSHLVTPSNLILRKRIAPVLGSPYEDRVHGPRGPQSWPTADRGNFVVISQVEARPQRLAGAERSFDELAAVQLGAAGIKGHVVLQRRRQANKLEMISVWLSPEAFDEHLAEASQQEARRALENNPLAPVDDRRCTLIVGAWSTA
jgi:quinol monooxygenase YgiN